MSHKRRHKHRHGKGKGNESRTQDSQPPPFHQEAARTQILDITAPQPCVSPASVKRDWRDWAVSVVDWEHVVGKTMLLWNKGCGKYYQNYINGEDRGVLHDTYYAKDLSEAIPVFRENQCALGLVMIACLRKGREREEAIRSLTRFTHNLTDCGHAIRDLDVFGEIPPVVHPCNNRKVEWTHLWAQPALVAKIALEENSPPLGAWILTYHLRDFGPEKSRSLMDFLVNNGMWRSIDQECIGPHALPDEFIIRLSERMSEIAKADTSHILPKIAAMHPDESKRMEAIDAMNAGGVGEYHLCSCMAESAKISRFPDTAKYAIDLIAMRQPRTVARIVDADLGDLMLEGTDPEIMRYAMDKKFEIWDKNWGFGYSIQWQYACPEAKEMLRGYFERNFDRLVRNKEFDALVWLARHRYKETRKTKFLGFIPIKRKVETRSPFAERAIAALTEHAYELGYHSPAYMLLSMESPDPVVRRKCGEALLAAESTPWRNHEPIKRDVAGESIIAATS